MHRKKILIIDDEQGFTAMLRLNLESMGHYDVRVENASSEAIATALEFRPDVILLDIIMPGQEGPDVAVEIRNHHVLQDIPIIFLTATVTKDEVDSEGGVIGGHPFVAKPSNMSVLLHSIESHLGSEF